MNKTNSNSNNNESPQASYQGNLQGGGLPTTPQNIKMPSVKPPKSSVKPPKSSIKPPKSSIKLPKSSQP